MTLPESKIRIDFETAKQVLTEIVAENPSKVYAKPSHISGGGCLYVHTDAPVPGAEEGMPNLSPGCIIGHLMHSLGVPLEVLYDNEYITVSMLVARLGRLISTTDDAVKLMMRVQGNQDSGMTWNTSLKIGLREMKEMRAFPS